VEVLPKLSLVEVVFHAACAGAGNPIPTIDKAANTVKNLMADLNLIALR